MSPVMGKLFSKVVRSLDAYKSGSLSDPLSCIMLKGYYESIDQ